MQALCGQRAKPLRCGNNPARGFARGGWTFARLVQRQAPSQRCDGHLHALVVTQIALGQEFLVQDLGAVFSLVPALLQVVEVGVQGGRAAGRAAHHLVPGAGPGVLAHRAAVQAQLAGRRTVGMARFSQRVHCFEQPQGMPAGGSVRRRIRGCFPRLGAGLRAGTRGGRRRSPGRAGTGPATGGSGR